MDLFSQNRKPKIKGDQLETDLDAIRAIITEKSKENIFCVMSTTRFIFHDSYLMSINYCQCKHSCFAPRGADDVEAIARLCKELDIPHIVNNAYGIQVIKVDCILSKVTHHSLLLLLLLFFQSSETAKEITRAMRVGRIDAVVSSTDKNFMVCISFICTFFVFFKKYIFYFNNRFQLVVL